MIWILSIRFDSASSLTQLAGAAEYTSCFSVEGQDSPNKCPGYDTKPSDGEAAAGALRNAVYPFIAIVSRYTLAWSGSTW